jgi:hypothetical protein
MKNLKQIFIILEDGMRICVGLAESLYEWFLLAEERVIVPLSGNRDYISVRPIYNEQYDQFVTYKIE